MTMLERDKDPYSISATEVWKYWGFIAILWWAVYAAYFQVALMGGREDVGFRILGKALLWVSLLVAYGYGVFGKCKKADPYLTPRGMVFYFRRGKKLRVFSFLFVVALLFMAKSYILFLLYGIGALLTYVRFTRCEENL